MDEVDVHIGFRVLHLEHGHLGLPDEHVHDLAAHVGLLAVVEIVKDFVDVHVDYHVYVRVAVEGAVVN